MNLKALGRGTTKWILIGVGTVATITAVTLWLTSGLWMGQEPAKSIPVVQKSNSPQENCKILKEQWSSVSKYKLSDKGITSDLLENSKSLLESLKALKDESDTKSIGVCKLEESSEG